MRCKSLLLNCVQFLFLFYKYRNKCSCLDTCNVYTRWRSESLVRERDSRQIERNRTKPIALAKFSRLSLEPSLPWTVAWCDLHPFYNIMNNNKTIDTLSTSKQTVSCSFEGKFCFVAKTIKIRLKFKFQRFANDIQNVFPWNPAVFFSFIEVNYDLLRSFSFENSIWILLRLTRKFAHRKFN